MSDTTIVKISLAELRSIWSLGFDSGRVYGQNGASFDDQTPLWQADVRRMKSYDKNLALRIERGLTKRAPDAPKRGAKVVKSKSKKVANPARR